MNIITICSRAPILASPDMGHLILCLTWGVLYFALTVAVNDPLDPFSGNGFGVVHHLYQNEFAVSAVGSVHVENGVGGSTGTSEGI